MSHPLVLHAVVFSKDGYSLGEAKEKAKDFIPSSRHFYRETVQSYRFRNIPKQKFVARSFRSKKIAPSITLVFGHLNPEYQGLEGGGLFDMVTKGIQKVKDWLVPDRYTRHSLDTVKKYGSRPIQRLDIYRTPIQSAVRKLLDVVTLGHFSKASKDAGYDTLFHVALIANVGDKNLVIEKNERINIDTSYPTSADTEIYHVDLQGKSFTFNEMAKKTRERVGDKVYFNYDAFDRRKYGTNCQGYIRLLLESEGLYTPSIAKWLYQDVVQIVKGLPSFLPELAKTATDIASAVSYLRGDGQPTYKEQVLTHLGLPDKGYSLEELSAYTGIPLSILYQVESRGYGAYTSNYQSVREKGTYRKGRIVLPSQKLSPSQWARARTYSFLASLIAGKPRHDSDIFRQVESRRT